MKILKYKYIIKNSRDDFLFLFFTFPWCFFSFISIKVHILISLMSATFHRDVDKNKQQPFCSSETTVLWTSYQKTDIKLKLNWKIKYINIIWPNVFLSAQGVDTREHLSVSHTHTHTWCSLSGHFKINNILVYSVNKHGINVFVEGNETTLGQITELQRHSFIMSLIVSWYSKHL